MENSSQELYRSDEFPELPTNADTLYSTSSMLWPCMADHQMLIQMHKHRLHSDSLLFAFVDYKI